MYFLMFWKIPKKVFFSKKKVICVKTKKKIQKKILSAKKSKLVKLIFFAFFG